MTIPIWQRLLGILVYMLPWNEALPFGKYLFLELPIFQLFAIPALPVLFIQTIVPLGNLLLFFILFFAVIRNSRISYFLRFNSLQAILINISLIIINFIFEILLNPFGNTLLIRTFSSTVLISMLAIIIFSSYECLQGKEPDLPGISEAVRLQL